MPQIALIGIVVVVPLVAVLWAAGVYNSLVTLRNRYKNAFSQIDVQLLKYETETLEAVIRARGAAFAANQNAVMNPGDRNAMNKLGAAEGALGSALGRLIAVAESYPELKGNQNMLALQEELSSTENKISFARQNYNDSVTRYNTKREHFPTVIFAAIFNFGEAALFEIENTLEREAPKVQF